MDKFQAYKAFLSVVELGSFVAASRALNISKPVVSRLVVDLEDFLNVRLIQRTTRQLSLTDSGRIFYPKCKQLMESLEEAELAISDRVVSSKGRIRISVPFSYGTSHLAAWWAKFLNLYPHIELEVSLSDTMVNLIEEEYDLAIRIGALGNANLIIKKIASSRLVLSAAPSYLRASGPLKTPKDLLQHKTISYSLASFGNDWQFTGSKGEEHSVRVLPHAVTNNGETGRALAIGGQGLALLPEFLLGEAFQSGELLEVLPQFQARPIGIYAVYPSRQHLPQKVQLLIRFLTQALAGNPQLKT